MRYLLPIIESNLWAKFSAVCFLVLFLFLVFRTYRPSAKKNLETYSKIVFDEAEIYERER